MVGKERNTGTYLPVYRASKLRRTALAQRFQNPKSHKETIFSILILLAWNGMLSYLKHPLCHWCSLTQLLTSLNVLILERKLCMASICTLYRIPAIHRVIQSSRAILQWVGGEIICSGKCKLHLFSLDSPPFPSYDF